MKKLHNELGAENDETTGAVLHHAGQYDFHTRLWGLGVNGPNSQMVVEMAKIKPGDRVLDVGCGTGNLTMTAKHFTGPNGSVFGIDASPEMITEAQKKASKSGLAVQFKVGIIEKLSFQDAAFDVVISRLVIHHLPDDLKQRGFAEIFRVLKPGGLFFNVDFQPPANPILAHLAAALVGHRMVQQSNVPGIPPLLKGAGFVDVTYGPTRSAFLAFASGRKPTLYS